MVVDYIVEDMIVECFFFSKLARSFGMFQKDSEIFEFGQHGDIFWWLVVAMGFFGKQQKTNKVERIGSGRLFIIGYEFNVKVKTNFVFEQKVCSGGG